MTELEAEIKKTAVAAVHEAIKASLTGYGNPLQKLCADVVNTHTEALRQIFNENFAAVIETEEFREAVRQAFQHKLARLMVAKLEGSVERAVSALRSDPTLRARMVLAIEKIIQEQPK